MVIEERAPPLAESRCVGGAPIVGNDVIDLNALRDERPYSARFFARVLTTTERSVATKRRYSQQQLFGFFAAKEAAYKLFVKARGEEFPLSYRAFEVEGTFERVACASGVCHLRLIWAGDFFLHAVAWTAPAWISGVVRVHSAQDPSVAVRRALIGKARSLSGLSQSEFSVNRRANPARWTGFEPPRLLLNGTESGIDISLSHDGVYAGYALSVPGYMHRAESE